MSGALLSVRNLSVGMFDADGGRRVVDDLSFDVQSGEVLAIIGESGSGKSLSMQAITGLLPSPPARVASGTARFENDELIGMAEPALRRVRGNRIGMIFQEPMAALDPMRNVGDQVAETLVTHRRLSWSAARAETLSLFQRVRISDPARRMRQRPAGLSGGMLQRVVIAAAIACQPALIIADEPTTALDASTASDVLDLLAEMRRQSGAAMIFITHDIAIVRRIADRVLVMRHGREVETGTIMNILSEPQSDYTKALIDASRLEPRAELARSKAEIPVLQTEGLTIRFRLPSMPFRPRHLTAVDRVSLKIGPGETLALIGESGSGKTTLARAIAGLQRIDDGSIRIGGKGRTQFVFQNPQSALNPSYRAWWSVTEPLRLDGLRDKSTLRHRAAVLLLQVGLGAEFLDRFPHELSGGQRQRLGIARALSTKPDVLIADEAVSALDAETRMKVLDLLREIQTSSGLPILFITHDFSVVTTIADRVAVMQSGRIIEEGPVIEIIKAPQKAYTRSLISAAIATV